MKKQKIVVLGNGFVGKPLAEYLKADVIVKRLNRITVKDLAIYDVVINTVAKTDNNWCELNKVEAFGTNVIQAVRIAELVKGKYVFFSTGCIFKSEDEKDIKYEDSIPNPQCFYTRTKLMAEQLIMETKPDSLILRPRLILSEKSHQRNIINKLLTYDKVITCQETFTVLEDMLPVVKELIESNSVGCFNLVNSGMISPAEIMDIFGKKHKKITMVDLQKATISKARRVSTILASNRIPLLKDIRERIKKIRNSWPNYEKII